MALDFPNSPTLNQTFTSPNGTIWMWDSVKWVAITSTSAYASSGNVGRNLIHNPLFAVAQRGAGPWTTQGYTADRWNTAFGGGDTASFGLNPHTDTSRAQIGDEAAVYSFQNTFAGNAAGFDMLQQRIEDVRRLSNKTITVSFWAIGSAALKFGVCMEQSFGTGGSPSAYVNGVGQAVTLTTAWARYSLIFSVPSIAGKTLGSNGDSATYLALWYSSAATYNARSGSIGVQAGTIGLWGVQLEVGSVATPLEKPDPRYDLSNCQRFFCLAETYLNAYGTTGNPVGTHMTLPVQMRATPTIVFNDTTGSANTGTPTITPLTPRTVLTFAAVTATGTGTIQLAIRASADL